MVLLSRIVNLAQGSFTKTKAIAGLAIYFPLQGRKGVKLQWKTSNFFHNKNQLMSH